jgi:hypothetical protein
MAKPSYPKTNHERAKLYLHAMVEVKERMNVIGGVLTLQLEPLFIQELCYLQLRYICELIAIGCLAAQGDYETQKAFKESHRPGEIFKALRKLYPDCFPQAAERIITDKGTHHHHHLDFGHKPGAYTEADVTKLWAKAGDCLHRGSLTKYLRTTFGKPPTLDSIQTHIKGLTQLLNTHIIPIQKNPDEDVRILVEMGQWHEPSRLMFLHFNQADATIRIDEYLAERVR